MNEKDWHSHGIHNTVFKSVILAASPIVIGILTAIWFSKQKPYFPTIWAFATIGASVIYVIFVGIYSRNEVNRNRSILEYSDQVTAYDDIMAGLINGYRHNSDGISAIAKNVEKSRQINLNLWSFDKASEEICYQVYEALRQISKTDEICVTYVKRIGDDQDLAVKMTGFYNRERSNPRIFRISRKASDFTIPKYHDVVLFERNASDTEILMSSEEINAVFNYRSPEVREKNKKKYSQYIAIPVMCEDKKMVGLLQVIYRNGTQYSNDKEVVLNMANKYLRPFANYLLLLYKVEKAIMAKPIEESE